jgi:hypothetical protein
MKNNRLRNNLGTIYPWKKAKNATSITYLRNSLWRKAVIRSISKGLEMPMVYTWIHCPLGVIDGASSPTIYHSTTGKPLKNGRQMTSDVRIEVGRQWLRDHLTNKQFASYAAERIANKEIQG